MPVANLKNKTIPSFKRHVPDHGDSASIERLLGTNLSVEDLSHVDRDDPRTPTPHKGSDDVLAVPAPPKKKTKRRKFRDEAVQVTLLDHEKNMKQQQMKIKKMAQDNVKLESQVRTYEQRLREMRQDAVYRDLSGKDTDREGVCLPVREVYRSLRNLLRSAWFQFWLKLQIKLEEKHRQITEDDVSSLESSVRKDQTESPSGD